MVKEKYAALLASNQKKVDLLSAWLPTTPLSRTRVNEHKACMLLFELFQLLQVPGEELCYRP